MDSTMSPSRDGATTRRALDRRQFLGTTIALAGAPLVGQPPAVHGPDVHRHVVAWRQDGRYGGWPANHGIWNWDDEIVCGCTAGHMKTGDPNRHPIDRSAGEEHALLRSVDGGLTWAFESPTALAPPPRPERVALTGETPVIPSARLLDTPIDFTARDLALTFRKSHDRPGAWLFVSQDRARTWTGPWHVPALGVPTYDPRTDYLVVGRHELLVFMTAMKRDGKEGRPLTLRTRDGGLTWERLGWIGPETDGYRIMPATVSLGGRRLYTVIRRNDGTRHCLEGYWSEDGGVSWRAGGLVAADTGRGNPASLTRLADGRLCAVYGYRAAPFGIRVVVSEDDGLSWSAPMTLRAGAGDWDLGYPRTVVRGDGRLVSLYYFNDTSGPERYIAATIWGQVS
jgi:hypothetical protein